MREEQVHQAVRERYGAIADGETPQRVHGILDAEGRTDAQVLGYKQEDLQEVPIRAEMGLSCGNPLDRLGLKAGETVLDLGSGGGKDCFMASRLVGETGRVIGIDLTPEMIELARKNALEGKFGNVEFRLGEIEHLPVADASVDVVISNCVMNLLVDKGRGFAEAWRVLKKGGRMSVSDIVIVGKTPKRLSKSVQAYTACLGGAIPQEEYMQQIREAGFEEIEIIKETTWPFFCGYASLQIKAVKG